MAMIPAKMSPRRTRATRAHAGEPRALVTRVAFPFAAGGSFLYSILKQISPSPRLLIVTLLLGALHLGSVAIWPADPPAKTDSYTDLRAATDQAVWKWSRGLTSAFDDLIQTRWA